MTKLSLAARLAALLVVSSLAVGCAAESANGGGVDLPARGRSTSDPATDTGAATTAPNTNTSTTPAKATPPTEVEATAPTKPADAKPVGPLAPAARLECKTEVDSVTASYKIALLRTPDPAGLQFWTLEIQAGKRTRLEVLQEMVRSDEFVTARVGLTDEQYVTSLYSGFLGRPLEDEGRAFWLEELARGVSRTDVALHFVSSGEFADPATNMSSACYF